MTRFLEFVRKFGQSPDIFGFQGVLSGKWLVFRMIEVNWRGGIWLQEWVFVPSSLSPGFRRCAPTSPPRLRRGFANQRKRVALKQACRDSLSLICGERGIRTPGTVIPYVSLANWWFQPLTHLTKLPVCIDRTASVNWDCKYTTFLLFCNSFYCILRISTVPRPIALMKVARLSAALRSENGLIT